jgi:hypothetical protein
MNSPAYQVVGVRADDKVVIISENVTRVAAETVVRLIYGVSPFKELRIEGGPEIVGVDDQEDETDL